MLTPAQHVACIYYMAFYHVHVIDNHFRLLIIHTFTSGNHFHVALFCLVHAIGLGFFFSTLDEKKNEKQEHESFGSTSGRD